MFNKNLLLSASEQLNIPFCALSAVVEVESGGKGFLSDGRPSVLFEGHCFWRELSLRGIAPEPLAKTHPSIVYPRWNRKAYQDVFGEWNRLEEAMSIHKEAAQASASWGAFQILGANYLACGFPSVSAFVESVSASEKNQLKAFCSFLQAFHLDEVLRRQSWTEFALKYNGVSYAKNRYHLRLQSYFNQCMKEQKACSV